MKGSPRVTVRATGNSRPGFTVLEVTLAMGFLVVALVLVAQTAAVGLAERDRTAVRQEGLEQVTNVVERARVLSWEEITPEWAGKQKLPEALAQRLSGEQLIVRVASSNRRGRGRRPSPPKSAGTSEGARYSPCNLSACSAPLRRARRKTMTVQKSLRAVGGPSRAAFSLVELTVVIGARRLSSSSVGLP